MIKAPQKYVSIIIRNPAIFLSPLFPFFHGDKSKPVVSMINIWNIWVKFNSSKFYIFFRFIYLFITCGKKNTENFHQDSNFVKKNIILTESLPFLKEEPLVLTRLLSTHLFRTWNFSIATMATLKLKLQLIISSLH